LKRLVSVGFNEGKDKKRQGGGEGRERKGDRKEKNRKREGIDIK